MEAIQCPHCNDDIELGDDTFGLFDCPHCHKEFEYESSSDNGKLNQTQKIVLVILLLISIMIIVYGTLLVISGIEEDERAKEEQEEKGILYCADIWDLGNSESEYCNQEEPMFDDMCYGVIFLLIGVGIGISTFIARFRGRVRFEKQ